MSRFGVLLPPSEPILPPANAAAAAVWRVACSEATYQGERATKVEIQGPDVKGLLACLASRLSSLGCDVIGAGSDMVAAGGAAGNGGAVAGGGAPPQIRDVFHVQAQGKPIAPESQALLVNALKGTCAAMLSATTRPRDKYRVVLTPDAPRTATHIAVEGPDVPGLLQALTSTLADAHCSILTFGGETLDDPCDKWFCNAAHFPSGENATTVFAARFDRVHNDSVYPMAWDPTNLDVPGVDRTADYFAMCSKC